ncbi:MAG: hypothetical protein GWO39_05225 [Gammaproteobacteria bacterium]|nr:hypothetical protein [Gammaproteobacteria bacterium]NIT63204.1 hypothetical protein [Gammaproteobacteria bacterium]NIV21451.1 hypothetical protein [Gammaproteobacteria bacterium]NIY31784.1 hypothetical protein [Gammaproteobacteria bacterium]
MSYLIGNNRPVAWAGQGAAAPAIATVGQRQDWVHALLLRLRDALAPRPTRRQGTEVQPWAAVNEELERVRLMGLLRTEHYLQLFPPR